MSNQYTRHRGLRPIVAIGAVSAVLAIITIAWAAQPAAQNPPAAGVTTWSAAATHIATHPKPGMSGTDLPAPGALSGNQQHAALIRKGYFLTVAGDCMPCHSVAGEPAYAGGRAVGTPFGTVFSPNITPSKRDGIGRWTDQQFWNAMHNGIDPGRSLLVFPKYQYPVMPYTAYSKLTRADVMAIKAYLDSLAPVQIKNRPNTMVFPTDLRAGLLAWRLLFFHPHPVKYQPGWSKDTRHGAYLVQALEHCDACHTPRNIAMASIATRTLAGGHITAQSWYAPNITNAKSDGLGGWSNHAILTYLRDGGDMTHGAPFGKMKTVVDDSLSRLPKQDVSDIVDYLRTVKPQPSHAPAIDNTALVTTSIAAGKTLYHDECARCHQNNGEGVNNNIPNLAHNQALWNGNPDNLIAMMLGGFEPWHHNQSAMPRFGAILSDQQIAAITNYVRTSWGNHGKPDATAGTVARLRPLETIEIDLNTGSTQATLQHGKATRRFTDITGRAWFNGNRTDCRMTASLATEYGKRPVQIAGACADHGNQLIGLATINGKTKRIALRLQQNYTANHITSLRLYGPVGKGRTLDAQIALTTVNY
ncbi:MAG TPA: cytochrome c [Acidiphilium sp.]|nr:MAG: hypothetical protein B7Z67_13260 [Acidiphilium sp. 21-60-14]OYV89706.1 MAG: hypothetical protein B7Z57_11845 [Acidiphilium sp. 37-60-79]HQT89560.1 cytochrome c [Acidiphilium sp.]HQU25011.1 cytochrome c [Acidiphilium sp.]